MQRNIKVNLDYATEIKANIRARSSRPNLNVSIKQIVEPKSKGLDWISRYRGDLFAGGSRRG